MFDLIDECGKDLKAYGYKVTKCRHYGAFVASLEIESEEKSKKLGLAKGDYYILNSPFLHQLGQENEVYLSEKIYQKLKRILKSLGYKHKDRVLIACLGNFDIEADRLGKEVFDNIFKFCPNIFYYTGIETADVIKMLTKELKIKLVVIVDALTTSSLSRLGTSFQISSAGMTPGSGVNRFGKAIDQNFLGAKCLSIGVPFMISAKAIQKGENDVILVPKDVKENVERSGKVIADALWRALK